MARTRFKISEKKTQDKTIKLGINTRWVKIDKIVSRRLQDRKTLFCSHRFMGTGSALRRESVVACP